MAARIKDYAAVGIEEFILSGVPHLEEAYWFGEGVLPLLEREQLWHHPTGRPAEAHKDADIPFAPAAAREQHPAKAGAGDER